MIKKIKIKNLNNIEVLKYLRKKTALVESIDDFIKAVEEV
jgi:hypothetical protein